MDITWTWRQDQVRVRWGQVRVCVCVSEPTLVVQPPSLTDQTVVTICFRRCFTYVSKGDGNDGRNVCLRRISLENVVKEKHEVPMNGVGNRSRWNLLFD